MILKEWDDPYEQFHNTERRHFLLGIVGKVICQQSYLLIVLKVTDIVKQKCYSSTQITPWNVYFISPLACKTCKIYVQCI